MKSARIEIPVEAQGITVTVNPNPEQQSGQSHVCLCRFWPIYYNPKIKSMKSIDHVITFAADGTARCLWTEAVPLQELGVLDVQRASRVEFDPSKQEWEVRLASNPGEVAFSHASRETCLEWEREALQ
jgi:hypothetical protein